MTVTVFGASGKVGQIVIEMLLKKGYRVTAFVHTTLPFKSTDRLNVAQGDIHEASDVKKAIEGSEYVISTLGSWHTPSKDILSSAMQNIIPAMEELGIKRLVTLTGSAAIAPGDKLRLIDKLNHSLLKIMASKIMEDGERHINMLSQSRLDWTVVRSPIMTESKNENYTLNLRSPSPAATVPRRAVAKALVDQLENKKYFRSSPHIHKQHR